MKIFLIISLMALGISFYLVVSHDNSDVLRITESNSSVGILNSDDSAESLEDLKDLYREEI